MFDFKIEIEPYVPKNKTITVDELQNIQSITRCHVEQLDIDYQPYSIESMNEYASMESDKLTGIIKRFFKPVTDKLVQKQKRKFYVMCAGSLDECINKSGKMNGPIYLYNLKTFRGITNAMGNIMANSGETSMEIVSVELDDSIETKYDDGLYISESLDRGEFKREAKYSLKKLEGAERPIVIFEALSANAKKEM